MCSIFIVLRQDFYCCHKHHDEKQVVEKRVNFACISTSLYITEGSQGRNWRQELWDENLCRGLCRGLGWFCLLSRNFSACFLITLTATRLAPPTNGLGPHKSSTEITSYRLANSQILRGDLLTVSSFSQMTIASLKWTLIKLATSCLACSQLSGKLLHDKNLCMAFVIPTRPDGSEGGTWRECRCDRDNDDWWEREKRDSDCKRTWNEEDKGKKHSVGVQKQMIAECRGVSAQPQRGIW